MYYLSKVFTLNQSAVMQTLKDNGKTLDRFQGFLKHQEELRHAYDRFRLGGSANKPPFDEVYHAVKDFLKDILPKEKKREMER